MCLRRLLCGRVQRSADCDLAKGAMSPRFPDAVDRPGVPEGTSHIAVCSSWRQCCRYCWLDSPNMADGDDRKSFSDGAAYGPLCLNYCQEIFLPYTDRKAPLDLESKPDILSELNTERSGISIAS